MASILNPYISETNKNVALGNGAILGWDRSPKRLWPTLTRGDESVAWGFSIICGQDILESGGRWSGVATRRNERGLWLKIRTVRDDTPAAAAGLTDSDFVTRINGRIVFHMSPEEAERLIKNSGTTLYLDVERNPSKRLIYDNGLHQKVLDFLYAEYKSPFERPPPLIKSPPTDKTYPTWKDNAFLMTERRKNKSPYGIVPITLID